MAAILGQFLIGRAHPNNGGISTSHDRMLYSEGDRPCWELKSRWKRSVWIPTVEHAFEDGLLMVALNYCQDDELLGMAEEYFGEGLLKKSAVEQGLIVREMGRNVRREGEAPRDARFVRESVGSLYEAVSEEGRVRMYQRCKELDWGELKIVATVMGGSHLEGNLTAVREYGVDVEVCLPVFSRLRSYWGDGVTVEDGFGEYFGR